MLKREALPVFGRQLAAALSSPGGDAAITLWRTQAAPPEEGEEIELSWPALFEILATRRPFRGRFHHPGWTPATFAPLMRTLASVRSVAAVVCMFTPSARVSVGAFVSAWADHSGFVFTSGDHSSEAHAFTAVLPYARLVSLDEHRSAVERLGALSRRDGRPFEAGARNPARYVYLPGAVPGRPFEAHELRGSLLVMPR